MIRENLIKEFNNAITYMKNNKDEGGTFNWPLGNDGKNDWALVLGWSSGYEPSKDDYTDEYGYHLESKIAYQPDNSLMQCDYDIDWTMPYDEESGEVDDMSLLICTDNAQKEVEWLLKQFDRYKSLFE